MKLFIAGEGPDDIGDFARHPVYRPEQCQGGVVESLLRRVRADGWKVVDGCSWKRIPLYALGRDRHGRELRRVLQLAVFADEAGCQALAFVRDRDGVKDREQAIERAIGRARETVPNLQIIGGAPIENIDAWILACLGVKRTEQLTDPKSALADRFKVSMGDEKAQAVDRANLDTLPQDARSLRQWLDRAMVVLAVPSVR